MKKLLLSLAALAAVISTKAQQKLSLYEEFSGENCNPCAAANPALWALLSANSSKVLLIKYQSPIPSGGPIYAQYQAGWQTRGASFYNVPFAPYGRLDGTGLGSGIGGSPGHVANLTQGDIDAAAAVPSPFDIDVSHVWNSTGDSITVTVDITAVSAFSGSQMRLHLALIEHLVYDFPPGSNGETDFHNVVRRMYPDPNGTTIPNSWTQNQTQTITITGWVPPYVDKSNVDTRVVAFIQNHSSKEIEQTAVAPVPMPVDVASSMITAPQNLVCATGSVNVNADVTLRNTGVNTLTSATIYYRVGNGAWQSHNWTGSLAANGSTNVSLPGISMTPGHHILIDSVALPNNQPDINPANNISYTQVWVQNSSPNNLPFGTSFENNGNLPQNYILYDVDGDLRNWDLRSSSSLGQSGSTYYIRHNNYTFEEGESNIAILPTPAMPSGQKALDFWVSHARFSSAYSDTLSVVYSTNCGQTWTTLWTANSAQLETAPATTSSFIPAANLWAKKSIDVTSVPPNAMIGFKASSGYGNNLYIDAIELRTGPVGIEEVVESGYFQLYPNPAKDQAFLQFTLSKKTEFDVQVIDATGRIVLSTPNTIMSAGMHKLELGTSGLPAGLYHVRINTGSGSHIERLSIVK